MTKHCIWTNPNFRNRLTQSRICMKQKVYSNRFVEMTQPIAIFVYTRNWLHSSRVISWDMGTIGDANYWIAECMNSMKINNYALNVKLYVVKPFNLYLLLNKTSKINIPLTFWDYQKKNVAVELHSTRKPVKSTKTLLSQFNWFCKFNMIFVDWLRMRRRNANR